MKKIAFIFLFLFTTAAAFSQRYAIIDTKYILYK